MQAKIKTFYSSIRFLSNTHPISPFFAYFNFPITYPSFRRHWSRSVFCHWLCSTRVRTVKLTWCPVGMLIWQSSRSSLFFFFKFSLKSMTECWLLLGSCRCDRNFFVKSPFSVQSPTPKMSSMWNGSGDMGDPLLASQSCYFKPEAHGQERQSV